MHTTLITGCNRGIGLELARQYAQAGWRVFATCRNPKGAYSLNAIAAGSQGRVTVHRLDVTCAEELDGVVAAVGPTPLDLLINNAGTAGQPNSPFGSTDVGAWSEAFRVNAIAPVKLMEAFVTVVGKSRGRLIACLGSKMGSISGNSSGGSYVYRSSKAALNAVVRTAALDLRPKGITVVAIHPGWVKTDMGGPNAQIAVADSVRRLRELLERVSLADSGSFLNFDGSLIPW
jgi:NAD(P)-dependent dehydrogenase (short-subunit alcohol dehydrogenase family)